MSETTTKIEATVTSGVTRAAQEVASDPTVKMDYSAIGPVVDAVLNRIMPVILHSTSQEPWYRSRVFWSAAVSVVGFVVGAFGLSLDSDSQKQITDLIMMGSQAVATVLALWGRYAKKPLGK